MLFKLICGLGNNDISEVQSLAEVYALAGADMFDASVSMMPVVQDSIKQSGLSLEDFEFCISISIGDDIHGARAYIKEEICSKCGACTLVCPRGGIERCIGCMKCEDACKQGALSFVFEKTPWNGLGEAINKFKVDSVEMHASVENAELIKEEFKKLCEIFKGEVSICISNKYFKEDKLVDLLLDLKDIARDNTAFVVQADGKAMSGLNDETETTTPCIELGEYLSSKGFKVILSGGVNSKTSGLIRERGMECYGLAYGSYARKIIEGLSKEEALVRAKELVCSTK